VTGWPPATRDVGEPPLLIQRGDIFTESALQETVEALRNTLESEGYARAMVRAECQRLDPTRIVVRFVVELGNVYHLGSISVQGTRADLIPLVRRTAGIRGGELYTPGLIRQSHASLRLLDLYRQIRLTTQESGPRTLDLHVDLIERRPRTLEIGVGYWSDEFLRAHARWQHRNLLRAGRGFEASTAYSRFRQQVGFSFWWPAVLGSRTRIVLDGEVETQREESFDAFSRRLELATVYRASLVTMLRVGVTVSDEAFTVKTGDPAAFLEQGGILTVFGAKWMRNSSDDRLNPTSGIVAGLGVEWAPVGGISQSHFISGEADATVFRRVSHSMVAAARMELGLASPLGTSVDLLPNQRFFAGGSRSMRGFERRMLGPLDSEGSPVGGEARALGSFELRVPLLWRFKAAVFVDVGQVWSKVTAMRRRDLQVAVGPGLMIQTPVGPLRADWGALLTDPPSGQPTSAFHVAVGHPF